MKKRMKGRLKAIVCVALASILLCASSASCAAGDKIKSGFAQVGDGLKDGFSKIGNEVKEGFQDITADAGSAVGSVSISTLSAETEPSQAVVLSDRTLKLDLKQFSAVSDFVRELNEVSCFCYFLNYEVAGVVSFSLMPNEYTEMSGGVVTDGDWKTADPPYPTLYFDSETLRPVIVSPSGFGLDSLMEYEVFSIWVEPAVVKTLTATVEPADATDKSVTWSAVWDENAIGAGAAVEDYIRLIPGDNGTCKVVCLQPFRGSSVSVKVTTNVGGYTANCTVTYEGLPSDFFIVFNEEITDETSFCLKSGGYIISCIYDNLFHDVSTSLNSEFSISSVEYYGTIVESKYTENGDHVLDTEFDFADYEELYADYLLFPGVSEEVYYDKLPNIQLIVNDLFISIPEYGVLRDVRYDNGLSFGYTPCVITPSKDAGFIVTITDQITGKEIPLNFTFDLASVTLDSSQLVF